MVSTDNENIQQNEKGTHPHCEAQLQRQLKDRHVVMISIGGLIGTGLFLGTATALANGGPVGLLFGYIIVGSICYCVTISFGEMIALLPIPGGHISLAERFVGPSLSFAMGWNYWYYVTIALPAELSAAAILISYWNKSINPAVWISVTLLVSIVINGFGAKYYGEGEFWFASIKIITITGLIILGFVLVLGGGPNHDRVGFRYWIDPGPFNQFASIPGSKGRFLAFWSVLIQAAFSYTGTECLAIAAGEIRNPRRNLPRAIKRVYVRLLLFYIGGTAVISLLVPSNDSRLNLTTGTAASSPFVIAMKRSGIKILPSIINACILTSAWSSASSQLYLSSRTLYGLAYARNAPKAFLRLTKSGLPYLSFGFCSLFGLLAYMGVNAGSGKVFHWFANMLAVTGLLSWFGICVTYIRFYEGLKEQKFDRKSLPYSSPFQPYAAWYALISTLLITLFSGWQIFLPGKWTLNDFITTYFPFAVFPILFICATIYYGKPLVKAHEMDFVNGSVGLEVSEFDDLPAKNLIVKFWKWLA